MQEITTFQILLFFGACLFSLVIFLLKDLYSSFKKLHDRVSEIEKTGLDARIKKMELRASDRDKEKERFWKELPSLIANNISPHLQMIASQLSSIGDRINKIEERQAKE
jgi:hypothetical protein